MWKWQWQLVTKQCFLWLLFCLLRLMYEVEVFTRFAGLGKKLEPVDVIQARCSMKFFTSLKNGWACLWTTSIHHIVMKISEARGSGLRECTWQELLVCWSIDPCAADQPAFLGLGHHHSAYDADAWDWWTRAVLRFPAFFKTCLRKMLFARS